MNRVNRGALCALGFSQFLGIGPMKYKALVASRTVEEAYLLPVDQLSLLIGVGTAEKFCSFRDSFKPELKLAELERQHISVVPVGSPEYPPQLSEIEDAPICLYIKGSVETLSRPSSRYIGIVGTRKPTTGGSRVAQQIASDLIERDNNTVIVSGLAYGIDTVAHRVALSYGKPTIAFLGCGVDIPYPSGNRALYEEIVKSGGAVVSEFPPGQMVAPGLFVARNRLISGLSSCIVVVEGSKKSGSLITARYAAEQGRDVFAVPGSPLSEQSEAPNILIREGATCVVQITDVGDQLGLGVVRDRVLSRSYTMNEHELRLFRYLEVTPRRIDEIVQELQSTAVQVMHLLSRLELEGCVERGLDDRYGTSLSKRV